MPEATVKECPFCTEAISVTAKKCKHCNEIIDPALREIENLKRQNQSSPIIVNNNNNNNNNNNGNPLAGVYLTKRRLTYILLALFLGTLGIHNFYIGRTGRGILQLLLSCTMVGLCITIPWIILEILFVKSDARGMLLQ